MEGMLDMQENLTKYGNVPQCPVCGALRNKLLSVELNDVRYLCYGCNKEFTCVRHEDRTITKSMGGGKEM